MLWSRFRDYRIRGSFIEDFFSQILMFTRGTRATVHESLSRQWIHHKTTSSNNNKSFCFKMKMVFKQKDSNKSESEELKVIVSFFAFYKSFLEVIILNVCIFIPKSSVWDWILRFLCFTIGPRGSFGAKYNWIIRITPGIKSQGWQWLYVCLWARGWHTIFNEHS